MNTAQEIFHQVADTTSVARIADALRVNKNTVQRWIKTREFPEFYKNDLLRMLGRVDLYEVGVAASDQYYTRPQVAGECLANMRAIFKRYNINTRRYVFVEPAAGNGNFLMQLPPTRRIGIDLLPAHTEVAKDDFLLWSPPRADKKYIVAGNPPFGRNGKTALDFVLKSFAFADFVGFILPPIFNSTGKGSCKNRLTKLGYTLLFNKDLARDSFVRPDGSGIGVATVFQVWAKNKPDGFVIPPRKTCDAIVDLYNICVPYKPSRAPSNVDKIGKCDIYLPRSFWQAAAAKAAFDFADIPYQDGYGIVVKRRRAEVIKFIAAHDWSRNMHTSTNSSKSLRKDIIKAELIRAGFYD